MHVITILFLNPLFQKLLFYEVKRRRKKKRKRKKESGREENKEIRKENKEKGKEGRKEVIVIVCRLLWLSCVCD